MFQWPPARWRGQGVCGASEREDFLEEESSEGLCGLRNTLRWRKQHQQGPGGDLRPGWKTGGCDRRGEEEGEREGAS